MRGVVKWLTVLAATGMFLVLVMGATVTSTGSGKGCGRSWPLCNGKFIPEFAVSTAIEYSHRAVTGVEGLLVLAASTGLWWYWRGRREIRVLVPLMIFFLVLQAALGALAVLYPQSAEVLALHFGISLIAFASTLLAALFIADVERGRDVVRDRPVPTALRWSVWGLATYIYLVVYLGAYVRYTGATLACRDWPLCNGSLFPGFTGPVGAVFSHRLAAAISVVAISALFLGTRRVRAQRPDLYRAAAVALGLVIVQSLVGASIVWTRVNLFTALAHSAVMALLFGSISYLCLQVLPRSAVAGESARSRYTTAPGLIGRRERTAGR